MPTTPMRPRSRLSPILLLIVGIGVAACEDTIPKEALRLSAESFAERQAQTRRFDTDDETSLLSASAGVIQDLGFTLDESETKLGLIVASKDRDAVEGGQVAGSILLAVLFGVSVPWDKNQKIRISLVTRRIGKEGKSTAVRITFQRIVWNTRGQISKLESLNDPKFYQEFFSKLSKAVFLEAQEI